jgi:hypothetical protein
MKMKTAPNGKIQRQNTHPTPPHPKKYAYEKSAEELSRIRLKLNAFSNFRGIVKFSGAPKTYAYKFSCFANVSFSCENNQFLAGKTFR